MNRCCQSAEGEILLFTCAGAAHCGQVANRAAIELTRAGDGRIFCLAAVAAGIVDKTERARRAGVRVAIDGCEDHCTRKTLEKAGLTADVHVELTAIGIEKKPPRPSLIADGRKAAERVRQLLAGLPRRSPGTAESSLHPDDGITGGA